MRWLTRDSLSSTRILIQIVRRSNMGRYLVELRNSNLIRTTVAHGRETMTGLEYHLLWPTNNNSLASVTSSTASLLWRNQKRKLSRKLSNSIQGSHQRQNRTSKKSKAHQLKKKNNLTLVKSLIRLLRNKWQVVSTKNTQKMEATRSRWLKNRRKSTHRRKTFRKYHRNLTSKLTRIQRSTHKQRRTL